ncbi:MucB/RseB C-terminal domain-containing protein [Rheinheimera sp.]|uniref:MucB/RseB C-terminal domain-containing protein n=1 Tax=Rheinheimera sp. TaxID=1869214 RepID=UPI00307DA463
MHWQGVCCAFILLTFSGLSQADDSGWTWFQRCQQAVRQYNFEASFVVIKPNQVDSYRWLHGVQGDDELEQLMPLEQAGLEILRRNDKVYYFAPERSAMATNNQSIKELPALLYQDLDRIQQLYDAVAGGVTQLSGRNAQLLRLTAFDNDRPGYWLWLDAQTGFPLKIDTIGQQKDPLERWVVTHIQPLEQFPAALTPALTAQLPQNIPPLPDQQVPQSPLELAWLPAGYQALPVASVAQPNQVMEQWLLSDGLHQVSVFVQPTAQLPAQAYRDGATTIFVMPKNQFDVTVIGPVSIEVARQIAESVQ